MNKRVLSFVFLLIPLIGFCQSPKRMIKKIGNDPVYFIDSVNVEQSEMMNYDPSEISIVNVYKDKDALELMGDEGKDGVIYIETKNFVKKRYWRYFCTKSNEYAKAIPNYTEDKEVQYILNDRILDKDFEGDLALIDDSIFKGLRIVNATDLKKKYKVKDKSIGVIIKSDTPKNLYKARKKF